MLTERQCKNCQEPLEAADINHYCSTTCYRTSRDTSLPAVKGRQAPLDRFPRRSEVGKCSRCGADRLYLQIDIVSPAPALTCSRCGAYLFIQP